MEPSKCLDIYRHPTETYAHNNKILRVCNPPGKPAPLYWHPSPYQPKEPVPPSEEGCDVSVMNGFRLNNPVEPATGAKSESIPCISLSAKGDSIQTSLAYNSQMIFWRKNSNIAPGWTMGNTARLDFSFLGEARIVDYIGANGERYFYRGTDSDDDGLEDGDWPGWISGADTADISDEDRKTTLRPTYHENGYGAPWTLSWGSGETFVWSPDLATSCDPQGNCKKVYWEQLGGLSLTKNTGSNGWGDAGAESSDTLSANASGTVSFVPESLERLVVGFSHAADPVDHLVQRIDYGIFARHDGKLFAWMSGNSGIEIGTYEAGDKLAVARTGSNVYLQKNNQTLHTIGDASTGELRFDMSVYADGLSTKVSASFTDFPMGFRAIAGLDDGRVQTLEKTAGDDAWDAGAESSVTLAENADGWVAFTPKLVERMAAGFSFADDPEDHMLPRIDYGIYARHDAKLFLVTDGSVSDEIGSYQAGDRLSVKREGSSIYLQKNGATLYSIDNASTAELRFDTSVYHLGMKADIESSFAGFPMQFRAAENMQANHTSPAPEKSRVTAVELWPKGAESAAQSMSYEYTDGRLSKIKDTTPSIPESERREVLLSYDQAGNLDTIIKPDGATYNYEYGSGDLAHYIVRKTLPNMQLGSDTETEGWYIDISYEPSPVSNGLFRVKKQTWFNAQGQAQKEQRYQYKNNGFVDVEYWDMSGTETLVREVRYERDGGGRITREYVPNSNQVYTETVYCDFTDYPSACPTAQSQNKPKTVIYPDGSRVEYTYDRKGNLLTEERL